jgi:hypothetical protein
MIDPTLEEGWGQTAHLGTQSYPGWGWDSNSDCPSSWQSFSVARASQQLRELDAQSQCTTKGTLRTAASLEQCPLKPHCRHHLPLGDSPTVPSKELGEVGFLDTIVTFS